jgi:hypothetical protein
VCKIKLLPILIIILEAIQSDIGCAEAEKKDLILKTFSAVHITWQQYLSAKDFKLVAAISTDSRYAFHTIRNYDGLITTHVATHETCPEKFCLNLRMRARTSTGHD